MIVKSAAGAHRPALPAPFFSTIFHINGTIEPLYLGLLRGNPRGRRFRATRSKARPMR
jgi:hypothetical protein